MKIPSKLYLHILVIIGIFAAGVTSKSDIPDIDKIIQEWEAEKEAASENMTIAYPRAGAMFPQEFVAPTFLWKDNSNPDGWIVRLVIDGENEIAAIFSDSQEWTPDNFLWERIKKAFSIITGLKALLKRRLGNWDFLQSRYSGHPCCLAKERITGWVRKSGNSCTGSFPFCLSDP